MPATHDRRVETLAALGCKASRMPWKSAGRASLACVAGKEAPPPHPALSPKCACK